VKIFPHIAIAFFVATGFVLLLTPKTFWPSFYDLPYMGWAALVCALLIFAAPVKYKFPLAVILIISGAGDLGLYELYRYGFEYDKLVHFIVPLIATLVLSREFGMKKTILIMLAGAVAWELYEYLADALIKTHLFGIYRHQIFRDTMMDLIMNGSGVIMAICLKFLSKPRSSLSSGTYR